MNMKNPTATPYRLFVLLAGLLALAITSARAADDYSDWYNDGEVVVLEPFYVTAEPEQDWVSNFESAWDSLMDMDFLSGLNEQIWDDFIESLPNDVFDPAYLDCLRAKEKAVLAKGADDQVGNNVKITNPATVGLTSADLNHAPSGFSAVVYVDSVTNKITVSFAGTNSLFDVPTDVGQAFGLQSTQYDKAMDLAEKIVNENPGMQFEFVGHSLGGGLASAASLFADIPATTFNAAGLHSATVGRRGKSLANAESLIDAFYVAGEGLSVTQDTTPLPNAAGERHRLEPASHLQFYEVLEKHYIESVIDSFAC